MAAVRVTLPSSEVTTAWCPRFQPQNGLPSRAAVFRVNGEERSFPGGRACDFEDQELLPRQGVMPRRQIVSLLSAKTRFERHAATLFPGELQNGVKKSSNSGVLIGCPDA